MRNKNLNDIQWFELKGKWLKDDFSSVKAFKFQLEKLKLKEIPSIHRRWVWPYLLSEQRNKVMSRTEFTYNKLVELSSCSSSFLSFELEQINDIPEEHKKSLKRIIKAYEIRKEQKSIFYWEGLLITISLFLSHMDEETTFWSLVVLIEELLPDYYGKSMIGLQVDSKLVLSLLRQQDNELVLHLQTFRCDFGTLSSKIFVSTCLTILLYLKEHILVLSDASEVLERIQHYTRCQLREPKEQQLFLELREFLDNTLEDKRIHELRTKVQKQVFNEKNELIKRKKNILFYEWKDSQQNLYYKDQRTRNWSNLKEHWKKEHERYLEKQSTTDQTIKEEISEEFFLNLIQLCSNGIPQEHRKWVWPLLLYKHKYSMRSEMSYSELVEKGHGWEVFDSLEIDLDIERTNFLKEEQWGAMRRILVAYSQRNKTIGYCQGMNLVIAALLSFLEEEEAFWCLVIIVERLVPEYHVNSMIGIHIDCAVLELLLENYDPILKSHLKSTNSFIFDVISVIFIPNYVLALTEVGLNMQIICTKWLIALFVCTLPNETMFHVFDLLFLHSGEGATASKVLLGISLSILLLLSSQLQDLLDPFSIFSCISDFFLTLKNEEESKKFLKTCISFISNLNGNEIRNLRKISKKRVVKEFDAFEERRREQRGAKERKDNERIRLQKQHHSEDSDKIIQINKWNNLIKLNRTSRKTKIGKSTEQQEQQSVKQLKEEQKEREQETSISLLMNAKETNEKRNIVLLETKYSTKKEENISEILLFGEQLRFLQELYQLQQITEKEFEELKLKLETSLLHKEQQYSELKEHQENECKVEHNEEKYYVQQKEQEEHEEQVKICCGKSSLNPYTTYQKLQKSGKKVRENVKKLKNSLSHNLKGKKNRITKNMSSF